MLITIKKTSGVLTGGALHENLNLGRNVLEFLFVHTDTMEQYRNAGKETYSKCVQLGGILHKQKSWPE